VTDYTSSERDDSLAAVGGDRRFGVGDGWGFMLSRGYERESALCELDLYFSVAALEDALSIFGNEFHGIMRRVLCTAKLNNEL